MEQGSPCSKQCHAKPCIWLARGKFELTNQDSASGKKSSVLKSSKQVRKGFEIRQFFPLNMALNINEKGFTNFKNHTSLPKVKKCEPFCVSKLLFWRQKWVAGVRHGNLFVISSSITRQDSSCVALNKMCCFL